MSKYGKTEQDKVEVILMAARRTDIREMVVHDIDDDPETSTSEGRDDSLNSYGHCIDSNEEMSDIEIVYTSNCFSDKFNNSPKNLEEANRNRPSTIDRNLNKGHGTRESRSIYVSDDHESASINGVAYFVDVEVNECDNLIDERSPEQENEASMSAPSSVSRSPRRRRVNEPRIEEQNVSVIDLTSSDSPGQVEQDLSVVDLTSGSSLIEPVPPTLSVIDLTSSSSMDQITQNLSVIDLTSSDLEEIAASFSNQSNQEKVPKLHVRDIPFSKVVPNSPHLGLRYSINLFVNAAMRDNQINNHNGRVHGYRNGTNGPTCSVCLDNKPEFACIPCGHLCLCENCVPEFKTKFHACPICRGIYRNIYKIFIHVGEECICVDEK